MRISQKDFRSFDIDTSQFDSFWVAHGLTMKHYCGPMNMARLCPEVCVKCKANIKNGLDVQGANYPPAVAVVRFRRILSQLKEIEQAERHTFELKKDEYGRLSNEGNPFEAILEEM